MSAITTTFTQGRILIAVVLACFTINVTNGFQHTPVAASVRTKELILVDDSGRPAASLSTANGTTVLRFLDERSKSVLEIGTRQKPRSRFIRFLGENGAVLSTLNSVGNNGESALYLGDQRSQSRVVIGALTSDMVDDDQTDPTKGTDEWGLILRDPRTRRSVISAVVRSPHQGATEQGITVLRKDGTVWPAK